MSVNIERELGKFKDDPNAGKAALARVGIEWSRNWRKAYGSLIEKVAAEKTPSQSQRTQVPETPTSESRKLLREVIDAYTKGPITSEVVTRYWQAKFNADGEGVGFNVIVPECNWSAEEIQRSMVDRHGNKVAGMMVYNSREITLPLLGRMYPKMRSYSVEDKTPITDIHDTEGWVKVYASVDALNLTTTRTQAESFAEDQGYLGGRLKNYILASQASHDLTGRYFDQGSTWSWLPGSRVGGLLVGADFGGGGFLGVGWVLGPGIASSDEGWRFEEVKRT